MKTTLLLFGSVAFLLLQAHLARAADPMLEAFQRGLFEEEANGNPAAAIQAYQEVLRQMEEQRKLAATVLFRLGECYRKLGRTNDAVQAYQQLLREHPALDPLATLARQNLAGLGVNHPASQPADSETPEEAELARLQKMLRDSPDLVNAPGPEGTPLTQAARNGDLRAAAYLLENGALVDQPDGSNITPLISAVREGHNAMVELLLARGADVDRHRAGQTPLFLAASRGYVAVAQTLLKHGADLERKSSAQRPEWGSMTPLQIAVVSDHEPMVRALIAHGADPNALSEGPANRAQPNGTALHWAARLSTLPILNLLIEKGADPNAANNFGQTPLHLAAERADPQVVERLLAAGANPNATVKDQDYATWTPLHIAAFRHARLETMKLLLDGGADVDAVVDRVGNERCRNYTPLLLMTAFRSSQQEIVKLLLDANASVAFTNECGMSPLLFAIKKRNSDLVALLLEHGASANTRNGEGIPALQFEPDPVIAKLLLEHGADPNGTNSSGQTLLHELISGDQPHPPGPNLPPLDRKKLGMAELLIESGAEVNTRDARGYTPLNLMGMPARPRTETQKALAQLLLSHGAVDAALEPLPDPETIRLWRSDRIEAWVAFRRDTNGLNRYTLLEALNLERSAFPFPDLSKVVIHRTSGTHETNLIVNLIDPANGLVDCSKDVWLEFGDLVELPVREHPLSAKWNNERNQLFDQFRTCVAREIRILFREDEITVPLDWPAYAHEVLRSGLASVRGLLTTSADLSRVQVRRKKPITGEPVEYTVNTVTAQAQDDLWLRDGDILVVPERAE